MNSYAFRLVNVFAETPFGGNPLCVFEDARGMSDTLMQTLAAQFNLSETTFVLPSDQADARVRIFTPGYEMRFAGHPTLGTAHVARSLGLGADALTLSFLAGVVPVTARNDLWTLTAPTQGAPRTAPSALPEADVAALLGLHEDDLAGAPMWVDTGADQFLVPLRSPEAVRRAQPDSTRLADWPSSSLGRKTAYVFAFSDEQENGRQVVHARYFFTKEGNGVAEDPGTGSACANLGGWLLARRDGRVPARIVVRQGEQVGRPCALYLDVDADGAICVGGRVVQIGQGTITVPAA